VQVGGGVGATSERRETAAAAAAAAELLGPESVSRRQLPGRPAQRYAAITAATRRAAAACQAKHGRRLRQHQGVPGVDRQPHLRLRTRSTHTGTL